MERKERESSVAPPDSAHDDANELNSSPPAGNPSMPVWQPVATRRTVMPAENAAHATNAVDVARELARELGAGNAAPARAERFLWAAAGALAMLLCLRIARLLTQRA